MQVIAGCLVIKDNKILLVKESKKYCYGMWNFPAGHVNELENFSNAAIRETLEETGYQVELKGILPIELLNINDETYLFIRFIAEPIVCAQNYNKREILEIKWWDIEDLKNIAKEEFRGYENNMKSLNNYLNNKILPLDAIEENLELKLNKK